MTKINFYFKWTLFEKVLLVSNLILCLAIVIFYDGLSVMGWITFAASLTNIICVIMTARREVANYIWGAIGAVLCGIVAFYYTNTGEMLLNWVYYTPMHIVGLFMWRKHSDDNVTVEAKRMTRVQIAVTAVLAAAFAYGYAVLIYQRDVQIFLYGYVSKYGFYKYLIDASVTSMSVVAMFLLVKRYSEQWLLWVAVDIIAVILWTITFDPIMILLKIYFGVNAVYGYVVWSKPHKKKHENAENSA